MSTTHSNADGNRKRAIVRRHKTVKNLADAAKNITLVVATAIAGPWIVYTYVATNEARIAELEAAKKERDLRITELEIQKREREDVPSLEINFDIDPVDTGVEPPYLIQIVVRVTNVGKRHASFSYEDGKLLAVSRVRLPNDELQFDAPHHPQHVRLFQGKADSWISSSIEPHAPQTYTFLFPAPEPGLYYIQFKARMSDEDAKREVDKYSEEIHAKFSPDRPAFWTESMYYYVKPISKSH